MCPRSRGPAYNDTRRRAARREPHHHATPTPRRETPERRQEEGRAGRGRPWGTRTPAPVWWPTTCTNRTAVKAGGARMQAKANGHASKHTHTRQHTTHPTHHMHTRAQASQPNRSKSSEPAGLCLSPSNEEQNPKQPRPTPLSCSCRSSKELGARAAGLCLSSAQARSPQASVYTCCKKWRNTLSFQIALTLQCSRFHPLSPAARVLLAAQYPRQQSDGCAPSGQRRPHGELGDATHRETTPRRKPGHATCVEAILANASLGHVAARVS